MSQCPKVSLPVWHQANSCAIATRITETQLPELCPTASCGRKNQCRLHSFSGQNDTSKRCPSRQLYLISMLARLHSCLINIFTDDDKGYPDFPLACLCPCLLVLPFIDRCCLGSLAPEAHKGTETFLISLLDADGVQPNPLSRGDTQILWPIKGSHSRGEV